MEKLYKQLKTTERHFIFSMSRDNNFNLIRLIAATMVLVWHSYYNKGEPFGERMRFIDMGGFAVKTFFVISGFLLALSLSRNPSLPGYFFSRLMRIMPAWGETKGLKHGDWKPFWIPFALCWPYLVTRLAFMPVRPLYHLLERNDISYGVYLYAFPVTQLIIYRLGDAATPFKVIALVMVITFPLGYLSWRFVELPLLHWSKKMKQYFLVQDNIPALGAASTVQGACP